jgi:hypothetical protein
VPETEKKETDALFAAVVQSMSAKIDKNGHLSVWRAAKGGYRLAHCPYTVDEDGEAARVCGQWCPQLRVSMAGLSMPDLPTDMGVSALDPVVEVGCGGAVYLLKDTDGLWAEMAKDDSKSDRW